MPRASLVKPDVVQFGRENYPVLGSWVYRHMQTAQAPKVLMQ